MSPDAFTAFFILLGSVPLGYGLWQRWREQRPRAWLQVPGKVSASRIDKQHAGQGRYQYVTEVEYEYRHDEQTFRSRRIRMSNYQSGRKREAESLLSRYPVGGSVTVFIDPQRSESSVLEFGPTLLSSLCIGLGATLGLLALLPLVLR